MTSGPVAQTASTTSGNEIASLLLGTGAGGNVQKPASGATTRLYYGLYLQDTWRLSKRITINPGIRYELHRPTTERFDRLSNFDYSVTNPLSAATGLPLKGGVVFTDGNTRFQWDPRYTEFAPRLGVSIQLMEKLVFRAATGFSTRSKPAAVT